VSKSGNRYPLFREVPPGLLEIADWREVRPGVSHPLAMAGRNRPLVVPSDLHDWVSIHVLEDEATAIREKADARDLKARKRADTTPGCPYQTIKEAKAAGYSERKADQYGHGWRIKGHDMIIHPKFALSRTAWAKLGKQVRAGEDPHAILHAHVGKSIFYPVFREDQVD
jgi:hypothetical protein